jgi:hypothetical protein
MSKANPTWGAARIRNELTKIGIEVSQSTVAQYMLRSRKPPSAGSANPCARAERPAAEGRFGCDVIVPEHGASVQV